jgi:hypothetical protein
MGQEYYQMREARTLDGVPRVLGVSICLHFYLVRYSTDFLRGPSCDDGFRTPDFVSRVLGYFARTGISGAKYAN